MFVALFASSTYITAFQADSLRADAATRARCSRATRPSAAPILVDGQAVAESTPVDDQYKFQRTYSQPDLYAPVTGYYTLGQGSRGIEDAMNELALAATSNSQFFDQRQLAPHGPGPRGRHGQPDHRPDRAAGRVRRTRRNQSGSVVAMDPKTGKILAMVSKPSLRPQLAGQPRPQTGVERLRHADRRPGRTRCRTARSRATSTRRGRRSS